MKKLKILLIGIVFLSEMAVFAVTVGIFNKDVFVEKTEAAYQMCQGKRVAILDCKWKSKKTAFSTADGSKNYWVRYQECDIKKVNKYTCEVGKCGAECDAFSSKKGYVCNENCTWVKAPQCYKTSDCSGKTACVGNRTKTYKCDTKNGTLVPVASAYGNTIYQLGGKCVKNTTKCVKGKCGATCSTNADCPVGGTCSTKYCMCYMQ